MKSEDLTLKSNTPDGIMVFRKGDIGSFTVYMTVAEWEEIGKPRMIRVAYVGLKTKVRSVKCTNEGCKAGQIGLIKPKVCPVCRGKGRLTADGRPFEHSP